jgi:hypothetical protein
MRLLRIIPAWLLGALVVLAACERAAPPPAAADNGRPQLLAICEAVKPRGGSCGGGARQDAAAEPMSRVPPGPVDEQQRVKPVDVYGNAVRISVGGGGITLLSAGPDGEFGNDDDVSERCPS